MCFPVGPPASPPPWPPHGPLIHRGRPARRLLLAHVLVHVAVPHGLPAGHVYVHQGRVRAGRQREWRHGAAAVAGGRVWAWSRRVAPHCHAPHATRCLRHRRRRHAAGRARRDERESTAPARVRHASPRRACSRGDGSVCAGQRCDTAACPLTCDGVWLRLTQTRHDASCPYHRPSLRAAAVRAHLRARLGVRVRHGCHLPADPGRRRVHVSRLRAEAATSYAGTILLHPHAHLPCPPATLPRQVPAVETLLPIGRLARSSGRNQSRVGANTPHPRVRAAWAGGAARGGDDACPSGRGGAPRRLLVRRLPN